jgi:hypothetical protein
MHLHIDPALDPTGILGPDQQVNEAELSVPTGRQANVLGKSLGRSVSGLITTKVSRTEGNQ